jgi:hypothetical protein
MGEVSRLGSRSFALSEGKLHMLWRCNVIYTRRNNRQMLAPSEATLMPIGVPGAFSASQQRPLTFTCWTAQFDAMDRPTLGQQRRCSAEKPRTDGAPFFQI